MQPSDKLLNRLLHDASFAQWVHRTDASAVSYWETWTRQHPEHQSVVEDAARMIRGLPFRERQLPDSHIQQAWLDLQDRVAVTSSQRMWRRAAAVSGIVLLSAIVLWWMLGQRSPTVEYATSYGETMDVTLPDHSRVTLNANSHVTYYQEAHPQPLREVFLEGEAFFSVVHQERASPVPFIVRTPDLAVQVLGTEFNVNTRRGRTQVVLDDGQIELQLPSEQKAAMKPGELVEYEAQSTSLRRENVDTELFIAWRNRQLKFDDTPLSEVALLLEENYGVDIRFDTTALRTKRVTGEISAREIDTILTALSKLFSISIHRSGDSIYISEQHVSP